MFGWGWGRATPPSMRRERSSGSEGSVSPWEFLLHLERNNPFKSCISSTFGVELQIRSSCTWPGREHSRFRLYQPSPAPAAGLSLTELVLHKNKKEFAAALALLALYLLWSKNGNSCMPQLPGNESCSRSAVSPGTEQERGKRKGKSSRGWEREEPANTQAVFSHTPRPPKLQSLKCHLLN